MIEDNIKAVMSAVLEMDSANINDLTDSESVAAWDSLRQLNLLLGLEQALGIGFSEDDFSELTSYAAIKAKVESMQG